MMRKMIKDYHHFVLAVYSRPPPPLSPEVALDAHDDDYLDDDVVVDEDDDETDAVDTGDGFYISSGTVWDSYVNQAVKISSSPSKSYR